MREITEADLGQRPCMVIAHPDDETLWAGGLLARFRHLGWTVICCSVPRFDTARAERFFDACGALGAVGRSLGIIERPPGQPLDGLDRMMGLPFDCIVTHGVNGEYGHNQHVQVHRWIMERFPGRVLGFGWHKGGEGGLKLTLTADETMRKDAALDCYGAKADALRKRYYGEIGVPETYETYDLYRA